MSHDLPSHETPPDGDNRNSRRFWTCFSLAGIAFVLGAVPLWLAWAFFHSQSPVLSTEVEMPYTQFEELVLKHRIVKGSLALVDEPGTGMQWITGRFIPADTPEGDDATAPGKMFKTYVNIAFQREDLLTLLKNAGLTIDPVYKESMAGEVLMGGIIILMFVLELLTVILLLRQRSALKRLRQRMEEVAAQAPNLRPPPLS